MSEEKVGSEDADTPMSNDKNPQAHMTELLAKERMKGLARKYAEERNWILLDCLIVWLHII